MNLEIIIPLGYNEFMRKLVLVFIIMCLVSVLPQPVHAQAVEHIPYFGTAIQAKEDGSILVVERIQYDFGSAYRHGIYRTIPYLIHGKNDDKYKMDIRVNSVTDDKGIAYRYSTSSSLEEIILKIGDPDRTITGEHFYIIAYTVKGAMRYFSDHDELYWNATGNSWTVPITHADAYVEFTKQVPADQMKGVCFTGETGSTENNCTIEVNDSKVYAKSSDVLNASQGLTFSAYFPRGTVAVLEPTKVVYFWETWYGKLLIKLAGIAFVLLLVFWYILYPLWLPVKWFLFGRDPNVGKPVTAWFDPPEGVDGKPLTAGETGVILDEKIDMRDISAMIIQLAQKGYLDIVEKKEKDFSLLKKKEFEGDSKLKPFENNLLKGIFKGREAVRLKDVHLSSTITSVSDELYDTLTTEGYFPKNPDTVRTFYAVIMGVAGVTFNLPLLITGTLFGLHMARKTIQGAKAATVARGMKNFLNSQERQLNFQGDKQMLFEKLLPFAIAFGVEENWVNRFKDLNLQEPDWYHGYYSGGYKPMYFAHSLNSSVNSISTAATPEVSSTGSSSGFSSSGGFSGGGGGGGGGGSW
jgi:uncharacterized membrane protein YgcG